MPPEEIEKGLKARLSNPNLNSLERMRVIAMLAGFDLANGRLDSSLEKHQQVLAQSRQAGSRQDEAASLFNLGNVFFYKGEYASARDHYEQCLEIALEGDIHGLVPHALLGAGHTWLKEGKHDQALEHYSAAKAYSHGLGNVLLECQALDSIGLAHQGRQDLAAAEKAWHEALGRYRGTDPAMKEISKYGAIQELQRLAALYEVTQQTEKAARCRAEAEELGAVEMPQAALAGSNK